MIFLNNRAMDKESSWVGSVNRTVVSTHGDDAILERLLLTTWKWKNGKMVDSVTHVINDKGVCIDKPSGTRVFFSRSG